MLQRQAPLARGAGRYCPPNIQGLFGPDAVTDLMAASAVQTQYLGANVLVVLLLCVGAVLMAADRVRTELEHIASHDVLTGALNRRSILGFCVDEHERSLRYGSADSLVDPGGLGLAIVRSIVQMHDGSVQVESSATGTCFTLRLPVRD